MRPPTRVLLVDDDLTQLKLCALRLRDAGFEVQTASGGDDALAKAKAQIPDAILSDVLMGDLDGFGLCRQLRAEPALAHVPVVLLSAHYQGQPDQKLARHVGASALVSRTPEFEAELAALNETLGHSVPVVEIPDAAIYEEHLRTNAHQLSRLLDRVKNAEGRYRTLFEHANDTVTLLTPDGVIVEANERWRAVTGQDPQTLIGRNIRDFGVAEKAEEYVRAFDRARTAATGMSTPVPVETVDGRTIYMDFSNANVEVDGRPMVFAIGRDVTEQVRAAHELAAAEEKYRSLVERLPDVIWTCRVEGMALTFMTPNTRQVFGFSVDEMLVEPLEDRLGRIHPQDLEQVREALGAFAAHGTPFDMEYRRRHRDGHWIWLRNRSAAVYERRGVRYVEGMITDITERKHLEESLRHAQKMEAIGQLTGGIAHDFNNLLAVILANSHFLCDDLGTHDPRRADAEEIGRAAERAAALTRQLLAFSRHQVLETTIADLGEVVRGVEKMLRRLIGEDIEFAVQHADSLGSVRVDIGQIEQVIVNLVVNARDAMPKGGRLSIETSNVDLDEDAAKVVGAPPGSYVVLAVSDTGCGMDAETKRRIFEPFFTTKELGKGTGLGLSTCYGIVQQSGGHIWVYSEVGQGTVFRIFVPRITEQPPTRRKTGRVTIGGSETILVIEDDERVRTAVTRMLGAHGYRLLIAPSSTGAIELASQHPDKIDLVLSDVIMPELSGPDVIERLQCKLGSVRTLFMSGYTDHAVLRNALQSPGTAFVQKPFTQDVLLRKVRDALDS
jgi:two-component system cell cycle sensor histidine kinase/response regulator CckA